ncbi:hypothetical protein BV97_05510 [Novosphingobium resinovorum]|uniref:Uncharacterized protein n=1 Tax=Novosphingobium resinovorum TaxID=158500 RepID=A0A031JAI3_9SPHN|nr:hypothetical protein BV97_05510 [Novosphingobium resinovorum]
MSCSEPLPNAGHSAATVAVALSIAALLLAGCDRKTPTPAQVNAQTETPATIAEPDVKAVSARPPALTRGDLVSAAGQAASTYVEGKSPTTADPLVGRSFAVRVPFGCSGPTPSEASQGEHDGLAGWSWGVGRKTIQLSMTPGDWVGSALLAKTGAADKWEAVEGFWIPRPWLASETCPTVQADPLRTDTLPASPQTVGVAAIFETDSSRVGRRNGRAYEFTLRAENGEQLQAPKDGYRMLLEGRLASFPSGRAIECRAPGPDQRPVCIVAAQLERVAYEDASGGTLSEWRPG